MENKTYKVGDRESDWSSPEEASKRVHSLNGGR
jgi:hypothetical protein